jgi:CheY-like chemotaxis protein
VAVADSGIGITPEMLPRVFEIFSQAEPANVRSKEGLGVGLSLVKGLVELHGGRIEARSDGTGRGSTFVVHLPVAGAAPSGAAQRPGEAGGRASATTGRVLVADDNRDSADSLARLLKSMGYAVGTAYDGEQAVEAAAALRPDVALLDIGMPKLSGYDACRRIREEPWGRGILLIALTGWDQETDHRRTEEAGFDRHIVKPVDPAALVEVLSAWSSEHQRR